MTRPLMASKRELILSAFVGALLFLCLYQCYVYAVWKQLKDWQCVRIGTRLAMFTKFVQSVTNLKGAALVV